MNSTSWIHRAFIALGSNIEPEVHLPAAVTKLRRVGEIARVSRVWESAPVGFAKQPNFCNAAVMLLTSAKAAPLRAALREIEASLGRVRDPANKNGPRTIDLDIACFDHEMIRGGRWRVPDPEIGSRAFLAIPLAELDPTYRVPGVGRRLRELADPFLQQLSTCESPTPLTLRDDVRLDVPTGYDRMPVGNEATPSSPILSPHPFSHHHHPPQPLMNLHSIPLRFCYGHRLLEYNGKCKHLHGHTARVELSLEGDVTGDQWETHRSAIQNWVDDHLDARMILCQEDPALAALGRLEEPVYLVDSNPTTENIARLIYMQAQSLQLPVSQVRMWESPRCSAIYLQPTAVAE